MFDNRHSSNGFKKILASKSSNYLNARFIVCNHVLETYLPI